MALREDILAPIPGENPSGADLCYDGVLDQIRDARREDDLLEQGAWQSERKVANWPLVQKLAQEALATRSKDLRLSAYLIEALIHTEGFSGLRQGLELALRLTCDFWDTVHPLATAEDPESREERAGALNAIGNIDVPVRTIPITKAGYTLLSFRESRLVGYDDTPKSDKERNRRKAMLAEGKMTAEVFDKAFDETGKAFYRQAEEDLDACLETVARLGAFLDERLEDESPGFGGLKGALTDTREVVHLLLQRKREKEPDPVEVAPGEQADPAERAVDGGLDARMAPAAAKAAGAGPLWEPADPRQAAAAIVAAAASLRRKEPFSPAPYLVLRGLRWGELRSAPRLADSPLLEAPSTDLRQQVKRLAIAKRWADLLEAGEQAMGQPGSRAWLDLQRLSVAACTALGKEYLAIATAIKSELRALLNDLPELVDAMLLDDTPAANPETREWLKGLGASSPAAPSGEESAAAHARQSGVPAWLAPAVDAYALAQDARASGQEERAFAIMRAEIRRARSGRQRFRRTMEMVELAIVAGQEEIAQPLLEDMAQLIETHKLDAWEEPEQIAGDLTRLMRYSKEIQGSAAARQKLFERICRLDPVQALSARS